MQLMIIAVAYITAGSWCGSKIAAIVFLGDSGNLSAIRLRCTTLTCRRLAVGTSCNTGLCRTTLTICACLRPAALTICTRLRPTALACRRLY